MFMYTWIKGNKSKATKDLHRLDNSKKSMSIPCCLEQKIMLKSIVWIPIHVSQGWKTKV